MGSMLFLFVLAILLSTNVDTLTDLAINAIKDAESEGADVSILVERFNKAESIIASKECDESCIKEHDSLLQSIIEDANRLKSEVRESKLINNSILFSIYIPLITFVISLGVFWLYNFITDYNVQKFMSMEIEYNEDEKFQ